MTYLGYDVLEIEPEGSGNYAEAWPENLHELSTPAGASRSLSKMIVPNIDRPFTWFMDSRAAVQQFKEWFADRKGRHTPFWVPTWRWDLIVAQDVTNDVEVFVHNIEHEYLLTPRRRHLAYFDPTIHIRAIDFTTSIGPTLEQLTLVDPVTLTAETPLFVLAFCRLLTDDVEIEWHTTRLATAELRFRELVDETPEYIPPPPPEP